MFCKYCGVETDNKLGICDSCEKAIPVKAFDGEVCDSEATTYFLYATFDEPWEPHYYERYYDLGITTNEASDYYFWILYKGDNHVNEGDYFSI